MDYKNGVPVEPRSPDHAVDDIPDWFLAELDARHKTEDTQLFHKTAAVIAEVSDIIDEIRKHNCFYCGHFNRKNDTCRIAKPPSRPPTFIIVHGCKQFWPEDDIPF